jgi:putative FmdB family regulatory protein
MPIYDYRCDECGHVFSAVQSYSEGALQVCPNCGKRPRRLISMPAIVFKGGGWYKTDSRGAAPKESGEGGSGGGSASDTKSGAKTEKASETKSDKGKSDAKSESRSESAPAKSESKAADTPKSETKS